MKVLYVDDESLNIQLFEINFRKKFDIYTAESGLKALEILEEEKEIQVLVSDMKMPQMNGVELIKQAKELYPDLSCYLLTGLDLTDEMQDAIQKRLVLKCFPKPLNKVEIIETISSHQP